MEEKKFTVLSNKRYIVKPIPERYNSDYLALDPNHRGRFQFPLCETTIKLPYSAKHGGELYPVLTRDEQAQFEELMYMKPGTLSTLKRGIEPKNEDTYNYWYGFQVKLRGEEPLLLDMSLPKDVLKYKVLTVSTAVAPNWESRLDNPQYRWVILEEGGEETINTDIADLEMEAYAELAKIKDNTKVMSNLLSAMGKAMGSSMSAKSLYSELVKIIKTSNPSRHQLGIKDFLKAIKDKDTGIKALVTECIGKQIITKKSAKYWYDGIQIGVNLEQVYDWIKDVEQSEIKKVLELKVKE